MRTQRYKTRTVNIDVKLVKELLLNAFPLEKKEMKPQDLFWSNIQESVEEKLLFAKDENLLLKAINDLIKEGRFRVSVRKSEFLILQRVS